jgi:hypothetical protein
MPPDQVPRVFHSSGILDEDDPCTIRLPPDPRPSAELEECLLATTTRIARERWNAREYEDGDVSDLPVSGRHTEECKFESSLQTSARPYLEAQLGPSSPPVPLFSSQPIGQFSPSPPLESHALARSPQSSSRSHSGSPPQFLPPQASLTAVPIADEEQARTLLLPSARRTIAKLDDLLLGLHRARQAYAGEAKGRGGGSETQTEDEASRGRSTGRSGKRKRNWEGGKLTVIPSRAIHEGEEEEFAAAEAQVEADLPSKPDKGETSSPAGPPSRKRSRISYSTTQEAKLNRLGLRDWSDVLGMAALTGWDSDVVARAGERCARLFGEEMGFRTFHAPGGSRGADTNGEGAMGMGNGKGGGKGWVEEWSVSGRGVVEYEEEEEDDDDDDDDDNENDDDAEEMYDGREEGIDAGIDSNVMDTEEEEEEEEEDDDEPGEDLSIGPHRSSSLEEEQGDDEDEEEEKS